MLRRRSTQRGPKVERREGQTVAVSASAEKLEALAAVEGVAWMEDFLLRQKHNDKGGGVILGAATANASGYDGSARGHARRQNLRRAR